jgi:endonuclease-3
MSAKNNRSRVTVTKTALRVRAKKIIAILKKTYPDSKCSLTYKTPHQLLVATILSAQCTDRRVNMVTPGLFGKYKQIEDFAGADLKQLEDDIRSTGFFHNKAKAIMGSAKIILEKYNGQMPRTLGEMVALPGVGRKTGSAVLGEAFGIAEGIVVDTHVKRISNKLGFTKQSDPAKIERDLMEIIPRNDWIKFTHFMIDHGRAVCIARRPNCKFCPLAKLCPSAETK